MIRLFRFKGMKVFIMLLDCFIVYASYLLAYKLIFGGDIPQPEWSSFLDYAPWLGLFTVVPYYMFYLYDFAGRQKPAAYLYNLVLAHLVFVAELIVLNYWLKTFSLPRSVVIIAFFTQLILTFGLRLLIFFIQSRGMGRKRAMVVVSREHSDILLLEQMLTKGSAWLDIQYVIAMGEGEDAPPGSMWEDIDAALLAHALPAETKSSLIRTAGTRQIEVLLIPDFYELSLFNAEPQQLDDLMVYSIMPPHLTLLERIMKRSIDLFISSLLLLAASPVMLLMFILIPVTSKGRALFVQERIGLHEKPFHLLKFRSMIDNAEQSTGPVLAGDGDARITRLGHFIRATRIDELPQLINVLKGDMSLVGPRPERAFFISAFKLELPHYTYRLMVKPGLTGLAQVKANYTTSPEDKLRYDLLYIKNYSPLLDLRILFQTIMVVLKREQSRGVRAETNAPGLGLEQMLNTAAAELPAASKQLHG
ncbi:sugar transferase [Paenibacillus zeisoli]|uniref:Sugar transferase n=1 Tax=Paenibacillus zeisoli TaxID=2496267 RepID=A0A433XHB4_9BACL|nr:sugar transferase [Paenibacillus zeisoli]RUT33462.1 sugar transferase [Paenibacillus zeisoli]